MVTTSTLLFIALLLALLAAVLLLSAARHAARPRPRGIDLATLLQHPRDLRDDRAAYRRMARRLENIFARRHQRRRLQPSPGASLPPAPSGSAAGDLSGIRNQKSEVSRINAPSPHHPITP